MSEIESIFSQLASLPSERTSSLSIRFPDPVSGRYIAFVIPGTPISYVRRFLYDFLSFSAMSFSLECDYTKLQAELCLGPAKDG